MVKIKNTLVFKVSKKTGDIFRQVLQQSQSKLATFALRQHYPVEICVLNK